RTALMNDTPTSGPIASSMTHHERDATSSRTSFSSSHEKADLRERKKGVLEGVRLRAARDLVQRAFAAHAPFAEQHEAIAESRGVRDLMDREKQRATGRGVQSKCAADLARLAQIESIERLVGVQHRLRRQESDREQHAFALALREFADADVDQRLEIETLEYVCPFTG